MAKPHKATDKRRSGLSHNVKVKASAKNTGEGSPLADIFNARTGKNGNGKRAK